MLDILCEYEDYLSRVRQASGNTVSSYIRDIRQFSDWLERAEKTELLSATQQNISTYLTYLVDHGNLVRQHRERWPVLRISMRTPYLLVFWKPLRLLSRFMWIVASANLRRF